jgi:hypothetical protein
VLRHKKACGEKICCDFLIIFGFRRSPITPNNRKLPINVIVVDMVQQEVREFMRYRKALSNWRLRSVDCDSL